MTDETMPAGQPGAALRRARELVCDCRDLGDALPPPDLVPLTLAQLGLYDTYWTLATPVGPVYVAASALGISAVRRTESAVAFEALFRAQFGRRAVPVARPPAALARAVARRLAGERVEALKYDLRGLSEFERAVLLKALEIPRGQVRPYAWIAREIGHPRAVRAVGTALAGNPVPLLIPCHRVLRSDGQLGQYSMGGAEIKRALLQAEGAEPDRLEALARAGVRYNGSDTTHIYCYPTCRHARVVQERHRVTFASEAQAARAGYRPCKICRPPLAS
jgi:O-6-methylguanine DNA methyltransferase